jgi:hypothetical protein
MNLDASRLVDRQTATASRATQGRLTHTRFIHDDEVGVKWKWTLGWLKSQRWMAGVL